MMNTSGLRPCGHAVLVKPYVPSSGSSIIEVPAEFLAREQMMEQRAEVIAVGSSCWKDELEPRAAVGDRVLISKLAGYQAQGADGEQYRLVNDRDIFAVFEGDA